MHKTRNVLDRLPQREQAGAKELLREVAYAPSRAEAVKAREAFSKRYKPWYPKAIVAVPGDRREIGEHVLRLLSACRDPSSSVQYRHLRAGRASVRILGLRTLRGGTLRLRARMFGGAVVLGYHRVALPAEDPWDMCVTPGVFAEQMQVLRSDCRPVPLSFVEGSRTGSTARDQPPNVAVTFDDGYADVVCEGLPVLERFEVPATIFVVADAVGGRFWWDRLERVLAVGRDLPDELDLELGGLRLHWERNRSKAELERAIYGPLRSTPAGVRDDALDALEEWAGLSMGEPTPSVLDADQVAEIAGHPLVEIGSHTATHPKMPELPDEHLLPETLGSRRTLEDLVGDRVESFSYPHGLVNQRVSRAVAKAGYRRACGSSPGLVTPKTDLFRQPRLWPSNRDGDEFRAWLRGWTGYRR